MDTKIKNIFVQGAINPQFIGESILKHQSKTTIGGHSIFLGQVRADMIENKPVTSIEYTTYEEMALETMNKIREETFSKYDMICMHVYHSIGNVKAGEISLFVFTSSKHRQIAMDACNELVMRIKKELPIWGQEICDENVQQWKENKV